MNIYCRVQDAQRTRELEMKVFQLSAAVANLSKTINIYIKNPKPKVTRTMISVDACYSTSHKFFSTSADCNTCKQKCMHARYYSYIDFQMWLMQLFVSVHAHSFQCALRGSLYSGTPGMCAECVGVFAVLFVVAFGLRPSTSR